MNNFLFALLFLSYTDMLWWLLGNIQYILSNVKSLFDHVTRRYDIASLGATSERQDRQADWAQSEAQHTCKLNDAFQT